MRFIENLLLALFAFLSLVAAAAQPQKSVIISWPSDTPNHIIDAAKAEILKAGGVITHEYHILKYVQRLCAVDVVRQIPQRLTLIARGIAATGTAKVFEFISTMDTRYEPRIEEDQVVTIQQQS